MTFETLPVVHLETGRFPEYPQDEPDRVLTTLARRFGRVVLADVLGIRKNEADLEFLQHASRRRPVWADAGSRYAEDAMDLFVAGADAVTIRWNTLAGVEELEEAADLCQPGTLFLALEFPRAGFLRHPGDKREPADVVRLAEEKGIGIVYIVETADEHLLRNLPTSTAPRFVQGPFTPALVQSLGYQGVLLTPTLLPPEASG